MPLASKRILVTGAGGFLGKRVVEALRGRNCGMIVAPRSSECDLRDEEAVRALLQRERPQLIIHLAAVVGGIQANLASPGRFFYDNAKMGIVLIEQARLAAVEKFVCLGTVCAYPKFCPVPFREEDLWNGYPEETNAPYGLAKKMLLAQGQAYRQEYGFNFIFLLPANLYGPGDNFDPRSSHVIPALVRKFCEAARDRAPEVAVWGTGKATREFLYVDDAAEGILLAAERYDSSDPANLGNGQEVPIAQLAGKIAALAGFTGRLRWDASKPDGQPRRCLGTAKALERFGFAAKIGLDEGLRRTLDYYRAVVEPRA